VNFMNYFMQRMEKKLNVKAVVAFTSKHPIHEIIGKFGSRH
jgi:hypothetical protein